MKPLLTKLVEALRSDKYKQTQRRLRNGDCFCVMGLACELSGLGEWAGNGYRINGGMLKHELPPQAVEEALGLPYTTVDKLMAQNDVGRTFTQLADYIEENLNHVT